jgi:hypothetical protein
MQTQIDTSHDNPFALAAAAILIGIEKSGSTLALV